MYVDVELSFLVLLILEHFIEGYAELLNSGSHWVQTHEGECPSSPLEHFEMDLPQCIIRCSLHNTCKALFYTSDTRQCRLRESYVYRSTALSLQSSPSTVYYRKASDLGTLDLTFPEFQTVWLDNNEVITFRIFFGDYVKQRMALQRCASRGGKLVQVSTLARQTFFKSLSGAMSSSGPYWIDVTNKHAWSYQYSYRDLNGWQTQNGQPIRSRNWARGHPYNPRSIHCASMHAGVKNNEWYSRSCEYSKAYTICEI